MGKAGWVGVKQRLREVQDCCRGKKGKFPSSVADAFVLAEELLFGGGKPDSSTLVDAEAVERSRKLKVCIEEVEKKEDELRRQISGLQR